MSIAVGIIGLGFLILIHEAGHFFTALAVHMRPRKFYIGFPPALVKTRRRGIEYGVGTIPLGGYVKIPGMHRPAPADLELRLHRAVQEAPQIVPPLERLKRTLAAQDYTHANEELDELEAELRAAGQPTDPLQDIRDGLSRDAYWRAPAWKKIAVIFAGPATNAVFAILIFAALYMVGSGGYRLGFLFAARGDKPLPVVAAVVRGDPADRAGLRARDRILAIDGKHLEPKAIAATIRASQGRPVVLTVRRDGRTIQIGPVAPRKYEPVGPLDATWRSIRLTGRVTEQIGASLTHLVHAQERKQISSPVGIVRGSSEAAKQGVRDYLWVLGLISLSLALLNLLPLLPLDGGHIFFSVLEALRGRAVPREIYERVSAVGIALVLMLFFIGLSNDVSRLGGG